MASRVWGECMRSGRRVLRYDMVRDGQNKELLVAPDEYDEYHPQLRVAPPQNTNAESRVRSPAPEVVKLIGDALHAAHVSRSQILAERPGVYAQIGKINQSEPPVRRTDNVADMQRSEVNPLVVQIDHESGQIFLQTALAVCRKPVTRKLAQS